jgi:hypothetical protein
MANQAFQRSDKFRKQSIYTVKSGKQADDVGNRVGVSLAEQAH